MSAPPATPELRRPNPWVDAVVLKLLVTRSGRPICYFDARFPLLELALIGNTLWRTKAGRLWCAPAKQRRLLADGSAQYDDIIEWDGGATASRFSSACLEAIQRHSPELLRPLIEGHADPQPVLPPPGRWEDER